MTAPRRPDDFYACPGPTRQAEVENIARNWNQLRLAAAHVIADWDRNPEYEPVSGQALRDALWMRNSEFGT